MATTDFVSMDLETGGTRPLTTVGVHNYMEDPHFHIICMGWAINYEPIELWEMGQPAPRDLVRAIERGAMVHAWNAQFERLGTMTGFKKLKGWVQPKRSQWRCTMVRALSAGFPGSLEWCAKAMKIPEQKDKEGAKAMVKVTRGVVIGGEAIFNRDKTLLKNTGIYCKQDVRTEREIGKYLPILIPSEERQYFYDQLVADRGIPLDQELCHQAIKVVNIRQAELEAQCRARTKSKKHPDGLKPSQGKALVAWLQEYGVPIDNVKAITVDEAIAAPATPTLTKEVLALRREAGRVSTTKYTRALQMVCRDGTLKGQRQFNGAHTGRWAGRGVQLDNLTRPTMKNVDDVIAMVKTGSSALVESAFDSVMEPVSNACRSMLAANPIFVHKGKVLPASNDNKLFVGDFKAIESRNLALTTGQQSVLDQWRLSDLGRGPDVYVVLASIMFGVTVSEVMAQASKEMRFWGKTAELSLGYEGGTGAILRASLKGGILFRDIYPVLYKNADDATRSKVSFIWNLMGTGHEKDWRAARFIVERWRTLNFMTVKFWKMIKLAAVEAVRVPGKVSKYRDIEFRYDAKMQMLFCKLMSGRELKYPYAHLVTAKDHKGENELQLRAMYQHPKLHRFVGYHPYGGFLTENIVQAQSRDIMVSTFDGLENAGYRLLHTVHDEIITSSSLRSASVEEFRKLMTVKPKWAERMPLAADCWSGPAYKKAA